jgi:hypothetical protein
VTLRGEVRSFHTGAILRPATLPPLPPDASLMQQLTAIHAAYFQPPPAVVQLTLRPHRTARSAWFDTLNACYRIRMGLDATGDTSPTKRFTA